MLLSVHLGPDRVGEIAVRGEQTEFRFADAYRARHPRPVLGQIFEDDLERVHRSRVKLPPFFSNLLPEGALRELLAKQIGVKAEREPHLLAHVGEDLPGAVRVLVEDASDDDVEQTDGAVEEPPEVLKFSLAGIQLKLSALRTDRGLTIPVHGRGGDWIVKLPDPRFAGVPENEWSMMTLARKAGLDVADAELVSIVDIHGLPQGLVSAQGTKALAVRRFDRGPNGARIHMEDFAQILDVRASHREKYGTNFETIARILARVAPSSVEELIGRIVFNAMIGNGDAHIKNWSLLYPDRLHPVLSPAYDLLSTIQYLPNDDLGLNLARSKRFEDVRMESFERLARKADLDLDMRTTVRQTVKRVRDAWGAFERDMPVAPEVRRTIEAHWKGIPIL